MGADYSSGYRLPVSSLAPMVFLGEFQKILLLWSNGDEWCTRGLGSEVQNFGLYSPTGEDNLCSEQLAQLYKVAPLDVFLRKKKSCSSRGTAYYKRASLSA